jgi:replicative DNA helicase
MTDQKLPYSQEAEEAGLGAVLVNPLSYHEMATIWSADDFYFLRNRFVWQAMGRIVQRGDNLDFLTLSHELQAMGRLEEVGGQAYITYLAFNVPTSQHATTYAHIVKRAAIRVRMIKAADQIKALAMDESQTLEDCIRLAGEVYQTATDDHRQGELTDIQAALDAQYARIEQQQQGGDQGAVLPTGFTALDTLFAGGVRRKKAIYWGARTHMGKTAAFLSMALNNLRAGMSVLLFTVETTVEEITDRLVAMEMGIPSVKLAAGDLTDAEIASYTEVMGWLHNTRLTICPSRGMSPRQLDDYIASEQARRGVDVVMIDYMQRLGVGALRARSEREELNYISNTMPRIAQKRNIVLHIAMQLNRKSSGGRPPRLDDFKGSGNIEEDADAVVLLHREGFYKTEVDPGFLKLIVPKNRLNGQRGTVEVYMDQTTAYVYDMPEQMKSKILYLNDVGAKDKPRPMTGRDMAAGKS